MRGLVVVLVVVVVVLLSDQIIKHTPWDYIIRILYYFSCVLFSTARSAVAVRGTERWRLAQPTTRNHHLQEITLYKRLPIIRDHSLQDSIHYKISPITKEKLYKKQLQEKSSAVALEYQIISCYYIISASLLN